MTEMSALQTMSAIMNEHFITVRYPVQTFPSGKVTNKQKYKTIHRSVLNGTVIRLPLHYTLPSSLLEAAQQPPVSVSVRPPASSYVHTPTFNGNKKNNGAYTDRPTPTSLACRRVANSDCEHTFVSLRNNLYLSV